MVDEPNEPEPTAEELALAKQVDDYFSGRTTELPAELQGTKELLQFVARPPTEASVTAAKHRLAFRKRRRWLMPAMAIAASVALTWWFLVGRAVTTPQPSEQLLQAAGKGDPQAIDQAMQAYRRDLVQSPELRAAEPVHTRADAAIAAGDFAGARAALTPLTNAESEVIQRDAWFRLATIELRDGKMDAAVRDADRGLALGKPADIFTVNLYLARAAAKRSSGDSAAAANDLHAALVLIDAIAAELK